MAGSVEQRLQVLEDIEAIRRLKAAYCAACDDDHNPDRVTALFAEDAVWEAHPGIGVCRGCGEIHAFMAAMGASGRLRRTAHQVFNPEIDVDGDHASGRWRLLMLYTANEGPGGTLHYRIIGRYDERYVRIDGQWRFAHLNCTVEESAPYQLVE